MAKYILVWDCGISYLILRVETYRKEYTFFLDKGNVIYKNGKWLVLLAFIGSDIMGSDVEFILMLLKSHIEEVLLKQLISCSFPLSHFIIKKCNT